MKSRPPWKASTLLIALLTLLVAAIALASGVEAVRRHRHVHPGVLRGVDAEEAGLTAQGFDESVRSVTAAPRRRLEYAPPAPRR
jgi:hypothetical protein